MAVLTVVAGSSAGVDAAGAAASSGGDSFPNTGQELLIIKNGDGSDHTLTIVTPQTVDGQAVADRAVVLTAGHTYVVGPLKPSAYSDSGGNVNLTYDAVTSVTVKVIKAAAAS